MCKVLNQFHQYSPAQDETSDPSLLVRLGVKKEASCYKGA